MKQQDTAAEDTAAAKEAFQPEESGVLPKRRRLAEGVAPLSVANVQTYKDVVASVLKTCLLSSPQLNDCPLALF